jgi:hypothetical protein
MIPYWHYLVGLIPILVLMVPNERKLRVFLGAIAIVILFWFWGGMSKGQAVERDFVRWTLDDFAKRIEAGERDAVCKAITQYTRTHTNQPFDGFKFSTSMSEQLKERSTSEQTDGEATSESAPSAASEASHP